ncbi:MAG: heme NO-binding domain-containing protein [Pseudorhodobacter sp.]
MQGMINRALQIYLRDTFGLASWHRIASEARLGHANFEPMLTYAPGTASSLVTAAEKVLERPRESLLEDMGTYLVSHSNLEAVRRLLRFGGGDFEEFLHSLEDLPGRGRLALPELILPDMILTLEEAGRYRLCCDEGLPGLGHVMIGLLRAMADDYGALVVLDYLGNDDCGDCIRISLLEPRFAEGRRFELSARTERA